jgi:hypothetical protein
MMLPDKSFLIVLNISILELQKTSTVALISKVKNANKYKHGGFIALGEKELTTKPAPCYN